MRKVIVLPVVADDGTLVWRIQNFSQFYLYEFKVIPRADAPTLKIVHAWISHD